VKVRVRVRAEGKRAAVLALSRKKVSHYCTIPSLHDYVIVSHRERRITVHARSDGGEWTTRVAIAGGHVSVTSLNLELSVDEIYGKSSVR